MDSTHSSAAGHSWSATDTTDICPISIECGLVPRKSVDFSRESASDMGEGHRQPGACAGPSGRPVGWVPSAGNALHHLRSHAQPTPAELLAADATLNIAQLMDAAPLKRGSSLQLRRGASQTRPSSDAVMAGPEHNWDSPAESDLQLTQQQQQLAAACRARDARLLQQLLAAGIQTSAALDAGGNTALHLLLLPAAASGSGVDAGAAKAAAAPAAAAVDAAGVEITDVVMVDASFDSAHSPDKRRSGGFSWLAGCFGGSSADLTDIPSTSSCASSQHSSSSRTFLMRSHGAAAAAAAAPPQAPLVAALIAAGAAVNVRNREGRTPLMLAVAQVAALCGAAAPCTAQINAALRVLDIFCKTPLVDLNMQDAAGRTALSLVLAAAPGPPRGSSAASNKAASSRHQPQPQFASPAASAAQLRAVQLLMSAGADCNSTDRAGMTPLMHAAANPHICRPLLDHLLANGANARLLDNQRRSALTHALYAQNLLVAPQCGKAYELFLQGHYSLQQQQQQQDDAAPTGPGCSDGRSNASGSEPNSSSRSNATADLHATISVTPAIPVPQPNHGSIIRALCSYGALDLHPGSINTRFPALNYRTQLHIAMRRGDVRALEMLLAGGADLNARDAWGNTPLMYWPVAPSQPEELVEQLVVKLLAQGASPRIANNEGWLPLDLACELTKLGKVQVKPTCVPVHAILTGFGAKNSEAFLCQARHQQPMLLCMRCDSDTEGLMHLGKTWGSIKRAPAASEDEGYGCATVLE